MSAQIFEGTHTAIVTPFDASGDSIDYDSLHDLIAFQIDAGVQGIVVCGSTGEAATLSDDEYRAVARAAREECQGKVLCMVGIGTNNTRRAAELAQYFSAERFDGLLVVAPPYVKPTQAGLVAHFRHVSRSATIPVIGYNVPGRTGVTISPATIATLVRENLIAGMKDATGSIDHLMDTVAALEAPLSILSGEDSLIHASMACGASGTISATANIIPREIVAITAACLARRFDEGLKAQIRALPVARAMFVESNPIPVKTALAMKKVIRHDTLRLPLLPGSEATRSLISEVLGL